MRTHYVSTCCIIAISSTLGACDTDSEPPDDKTVVLEALDAVFVAKDPSAVDRYYASDFIQHNPNFATGAAPWKQTIESLAGNPAFKYERLRAFGDGHFVMTHSRFTSFFPGTPPGIAYDLYRVENAKIAEHWDCLQQEPLDTSSMPARNTSGHTMVDGVTTTTDAEATAANKTAIETFLDTVLVQGKFDQAGGFFAGDGSSYLQHNPRVGDGLAAFADFVMKAGPLSFQEVHNVVAEGNFVVTQSEGHLGPGMAHLAFYDMWRLVADPADRKPKIAEHWDCIEPVSTNPMNSNGMF